MHYLLGAKGHFLGDKGYEAERLRRTLGTVGTVPVIPGCRNCKWAIGYDCQHYKERHLIENAFCHTKDFRRVYTRYDKLAAIAFWLRTSLDTSQRAPQVGF